MTRFILYALVIFMLAGCASQAAPIPPNGGMYSLSQELTRWMAAEGDALVNAWKNPNGMMVFTRPYQTGWAAVMQTKWGERFGYFMNVATYNGAFMQYIKTAGFEAVARAASAIKMPLFIMPVIVPEGGGYESIYDIPGIGSGTGS